MEKILTKDKYQIGFCDVDFKDEIKVSKTLSLFEEVACSDAEKRGFGYKYLTERNYAFIVTETKFEFLECVRLGDTVYVETWPTPPKFATFGREYRIVSEDGKVLCNASSRWCLFDFTEQKILSAKSLSEQDYSSYPVEKAYTKDGKIERFDFENTVPSYEMIIRNSEYDHYMHVNNTKYADYVLNCFSVDELSSLTVKEFGISYAKQCKENQKLSFYRKDTEEKSLVCGVNEQNEVVVRAEIVFQNV